MTNKELQTLLAKYPDDAVVTATYPRAVKFDMEIKKIICTIEYPLLDREVIFYEKENAIAILFDYQRKYGNEID